MRKVVCWNELSWWCTVAVAAAGWDRLKGRSHYRVFQKTDPLVYFDDNFGKYGPILTIFSMLQQEFMLHKN